MEVAPDSCSVSRQGKGKDVAHLPVQPMLVAISGCSNHTQHANVLKMGHKITECEGRNTYLYHFEVYVRYVLLYLFLMLLGIWDRNNYIYLILGVREHSIGNYLGAYSTAT